MDHCTVQYSYQIFWFSRKIRTHVFHPIVINICIVQLLHAVYSAYCWHVCGCTQHVLTWKVEGHDLRDHLEGVGLDLLERVVVQGKLPQIGDIWTHVKITMKKYFNFFKRKRFYCKKNGSRKSQTLHIIEYSTRCVRFILYTSILYNKCSLYKKF